MSFQGVRVLVLDGYGRQVATIVQQLHDLGCVVTTLNCSRLDIGYTSHYPVKRLLYPKTRNDMQELKRVLDQELLSGNYDVVFPMREPSTEVLLKHQDVYRKYVRIIAAPLEAFEKAYDKQATMLACMEGGIPCPVTRRDDESYEDFIRKVGYPIAVKPRKGTGSVGFHKVENDAQMKKLLDEGFRMEESVVQEYIPQTDTQYIGFFMLDEKQELMSAVICDKHRWYPIDGGAASYVQTIDSPEMVEYGYRLLKSIGWKGEAHLDFIGDPREGGKPKVMEINGRIPASIKMCWCVGVPIIRQELQYAFGMPVDRHTAKVPVGYGLRYFQTDFLWLLKHPDRFRAKPSWFDFRNSRDFIWSWRDPLPFFSYSLAHLLSYRKDMKERQR